MVAFKSLRRVLRMKSSHLGGFNPVTNCLENQNSLLLCSATAAETSAAKEKSPHTTKQENTHFGTECWAGTKVNSLGTQIFISREYSKTVNFRFNFFKLVFPRLVTRFYTTSFPLFSWHSSTVSLRN